MREHRRCSRGTALGHTQHVGVRTGHVVRSDPQENVREGQVRQQLPLPYDTLQMVDSIAGKVGVFG